MDLNSVNRSLATAMFLFTGISGVWGLVLYARKQPMNGTYWGILACLEVLSAAQGLLGVAMLLAGENPGRLVHILYGITAVVTLPGFYAYTRGRDDLRASLQYGLICLFLLGVSLRAAATAA